jgi:hypothetical protein
MGGWGGAGDQGPFVPYRISSLHCPSSGKRSPRLRIVHSRESQGGRGGWSRLEHHSSRLPARAPTIRRHSQRQHCRPSEGTETRDIAIPSCHPRICDPSPSPPPLRRPRIRSRPRPSIQGRQQVDSWVMNRLGRLVDPSRTLTNRACRPYGCARLEPRPGGESGWMSIVPLQQGQLGEQAQQQRNNCVDQPNPV